MNIFKGIRGNWVTSSSETTMGGNAPGSSSNVLYGRHYTTMVSTGVIQGFGDVPTQGPPMPAKMPKPPFSLDEIQRAENIITELSAK